VLEANWFLDISKKTKEELKEHARALGLSDDGLKKDLLERISNHTNMAMKESSKRAVPAKAKQSQVSVSVDKMVACVMRWCSADCMCHNVMRTVGNKLFGSPLRVLLTHLAFEALFFFAHQFPFNHKFVLGPVSFAGIRHSFTFFYPDCAALHSYRRFWVPLAYWVFGMVAFPYYVAGLWNRGQKGDLSSVFYFAVERYVLLTLCTECFAPLFAVVRPAVFTVSTVVLGLYCFWESVHRHAHQ